MDMRPLVHVVAPLGFNTSAPLGHVGWSNRSYVPRHCDPRQTDYDARNIAWAVGDLLSIAASALVLTAFGSSDELHPIGARMPVTWLCMIFFF